MPSEPAPPGEAASMANSPAASISTSAFTTRPRDSRAVAATTSTTTRGTPSPYNPYRLRTRVPGYNAYYDKGDAIANSETVARYYRRRIRATMPGRPWRDKKMQPLTFTPR